MQDSDMFVVVDSVNNLDAVLKREKRYLKNTVIVQYRVPNSCSMHIGSQIPNYETC